MIYPHNILTNNDVVNNRLKSSRNSYSYERVFIYESIINSNHIINSLLKIKNCFFYLPIKPTLSLNLLDQNYHFNKSFVEEVVMEDNMLIIKKAYADPVAFKFVDFGPTQETLDSITESFNPNDFSEIIFLSKYIGDYNITKYGNKLTFENKGNTLVVERIIV